jgi:Sigma-70 region 2
MSSYRLPLVGFVLPLVNGDVQAAEDVVQETLLRGWQHARELNPDSAGTWLHTVAHNIAISTYHRRRRARPREIPLDENALPATDDDLDRMFDSWLVAKALNLRGLPLNVRCRLIVHSRTGATEVAGVWAAWSDGPVSVPASADWRPSDIASLEVATPARTLVTISAAHRGLTEGVAIMAAFGVAASWHCRKRAPLCRFRRRDDDTTSSPALLRAPGFPETRLHQKISLDG